MEYDEIMIALSEPVNGQQRLNSSRSVLLSPKSNSDANKVKSQACLVSLIYFVHSNMLLGNCYCGVLAKLALTGHMTSSTDVRGVTPSGSLRGAGPRRCVLISAVASRLGAHAWPPPLHTVDRSRAVMRSRLSTDDRTCVARTPISC